MAETVGLILLNAVGLGEIATAILFGTTTIATAVGATALIGGALVASSFLKNGSVTPSTVDYGTPKPGAGTQTLRQTIPPRTMGYGRTRIAGAYVLYEVTDAGTSYDVIALHEGRIGGFALYYLHDDLVEFDASGNVSDVSSGEAADGRYVGYVQVQTRTGEDIETPYSEVVSALPSLWTNAHIGNGVASLMLKCAPAAVESYHAAYPHGLPKLSVVADLSPIFDPRDETQSRDDPSTWQVSRNPVLQLINYLTDERGLGQEWDTLVAPVIDDLMAQADLCDATVATASGTEPRYQSSGWFYLTTDPADVIASILSTCDGWMSESGDGAIALYVGVYQAPDVTITDEHIHGLTAKTGIEDEEAVNEVKFSFTAPDNDYRESPGNPWRDEQSISDTGIVRSQAISYTWVQSHSQARRLSKRAMLRFQSRLRGTVTTSLYGLRALGKRWIRIETDVVSDLSSAVVEVTRARIDITAGRVTFDWILVNPNEIDAWEAAAEEGSAPNFPGILTQLPQHVPQNVVASGVSGHRIQVVFTDPSRPDLGYALEYSTGGGSWTRVTFNEFTPSGGLITLQTSGAVAAATYDVRVASIAAQGSLSEWSATSTATVT